MVEGWWWRGGGRGGKIKSKSGAIQAGHAIWTFMGSLITLRVQVPNNHILTPNLY